MRIRKLTRSALVLVGGLLAGSRMVDAVCAWREWQRWAVSDPSAADLYRTNFWIDVALATVAIAGAGLVSWLLRSPDDSP